MSNKSFLEFADEQHRAQAEEFLRELGRFAVAFERVCEGMRNAILAIFQSGGLQNQGLAQVVIGDKSSAELQVILGALLSELRELDEDDRRAVRDLLKQVKELTEARNIALHSAWRFGQNAAFAELYATTARPRTKQNTGAVFELHGLSAGYLRNLTHQSTTIQVLLQRLQYCIHQTDLKVSAEFAKPL